MLSGDEVTAVLDPLRNLVRRHNAGTILLHHSGKMKLLCTRVALS